MLITLLTFRRRLKNIFNHFFKFNSKKYFTCESFIYKAIENNWYKICKEKTIIVDKNHRLINFTSHENY
jgi:hypothetical protein